MGRFPSGSAQQRAAGSAAGVDPADMSVTHAASGQLSPSSSSSGNAGLSDRTRTRIFRRLQAFAGIFPFTIAGLLILALSGLVFWIQGLGNLDVVLLAAGFIGVLLTALMALFASLASLLVHLRWQRACMGKGLVSECEVALETGFMSPWQRRLPFLYFRWSWDEPCDVEVVMAVPSATRSESIVPRRRGVYQRVVRRLAVKDVLGLAALSWHETEVVELTILPHRGALDRMTLLDGLSGGEDLSDPRGDPYGDRVDMRQYAQGDSPRLILWKSYARTRKLLVRVAERAITAKPRSCAYLVAGAGDEAGAGLARVILERGFLGENWRFGADGSPGHTGNLGDALWLLTRSGNASAAGPTGLPEFLAQAEKDGYSACFLFVPPLEGLWIAPVLSAIGKTRLRIHLYTALDGVPEEVEPEPPWKHFVLAPRRKVSCSLEDTAKVALRFKGVGHPFLLADRKAGRICGDIHALIKRRMPNERVRE
jgi:hypothetical protein